MKQSSLKLPYCMGSATKLLIRLNAILIVVAVVSLNANPSMAYDCGTTEDFIEGHTVSRFFPDDLVFAGASRSKGQDIEPLGVFKIRLRQDAHWGSLSAALGVSRVFVAHVFHGDKTLEGRYVMFLWIQECDEYGCKLDERTLQNVKKNATRFKNNTNNNRIAEQDMAPGTNVSPPYQLYFFKQYNQHSPIDFGNADPIWMYLSNAFGLRFYQRTCGGVGVGNTLEDIEVRKRLEIIGKSPH